MLVPVKDYCSDRAEISCETESIIRRKYLSKIRSSFWKRLLLHSFNREKRLDVSHQLMLFQNMTQEVELFYSSNLHSCTYVNDWICSYFFKDAERINQDMSETYEFLCQKFEIKNPYKLEYWPFFCNVPQFNKTDVSTDMRFYGFFERFSKEALFLEVKKAIDDIKTDMNRNPDLYGRLDPMDLVELHILRIYVVEPEMIRRYERIVRLVIKALYR